LDHELKHVEKYGAWWNAFIKVVNHYETSDCCCPERQAAFSAAKAYYMLAAEVDNLEFDQGEYDSPENDARTAKATADRDAARKTYDDALKTLQDCYDNQ